MSAMATSNGAQREPRLSWSSSHGTPAMAPQQWHAWWHPAMAPQQWHPAMASSNGAQQWHPAMAPSNGLLPLVYHSRPQRLAFLMLRSAADLCRCNKPRLPSQKTTTDANNPPCRSQKPCHCRKKKPPALSQKKPNADRRKKPPNQPTVAKKPRYRRKKPEALSVSGRTGCVLTCGSISLSFPGFTTGRNRAPVSSQKGQDALVPLACQ